MSSPVFDALRIGYRIPDRLTPREFGEHHVIIPHSARSARFDGATAPWLNDPMAAMASTEYSEVTLCAPVGSGKTTLFEVMLPYIICQDAGPTLVVFQNDPDAKEWSETRLWPILKACEPVGPYFPKNRHAKRAMAILFPHMMLIIAGANPGSLQSKSIRWCIGDEVWLWKKGLVEEFRRRTHDRWNSCVALVSQAGVVGDDFHAACDKGQKMEWHWRCPNRKCKAENPWRFGDIKYEDVITPEGFHDWAAIADSVHMECPACGRKFADTAEVRRAIANASFYKGMPRTFVPKHINYHYPAETVWWIPWAKLVTEWIIAQDAKRKGDTEPLKQFLQKRRAEFWEEKESTPWGALTGAGYKKAEFVGGQIWTGENYRFLTVDVQRDHYWFVVRAWKIDGSSRLIAEGKALTIEGIRSIQEQYGVTDALTLLDAQHDTGRIYDACARWGWTALHGSKEARFKHYPRGGKPIARFYSPIQIASAPGGGKCRYAFWSNEKIKDSLALLRPGKGAPWETPDDVSADYVKQIDSEMKKEIVNKMTKAVEMRWVKIKDDNHLWDCECMQIASAMMLGVLGGGDSPA